MIFLPIGRILILLVALIIFLGWARRVLDNMRLTDTTAIVLLAIMFAGTFLPDIPLGGGARIGVGGALVPIGVSLYLLLTADEAYEKRRAVLAALFTGATVYTLETMLPAEPGRGGFMDLDPLWVPAIVAAIIGYLAGRSRRSAFIAGVLGVVLADLLAGLANLTRGIPGAFASFGGGGIFDSIVLAGFLAVLLAETVGEAREYFARRRQKTAGGDDAQPAAGEAVTGAAAEPEASSPSLLTSNTGTFLGVGVALLLVVGATSLGDHLWQEGRVHRLQAGQQPFRLLDEGGRVVTLLGHPVVIGDEYIDADNHWYRVNHLDGQTAFAQTLGQFGLTDKSPREEDLLPVAVQSSAEPDGQSVGQGLAQENSRLLDFLMGNPDQRKNRILLFHTHNGESYVQSDGTDMKEGAGGIHQVGTSFAKELKSMGFTVDHDETLHLPHDRGAYRRSRQTITRYLGRQPAVAIDIHRDAVPASLYAHEIDGQGVTKVRLVVGRQNPNRAENLRFARQLKSVADELYPGLVLGIYSGQGNYNQDLGPRVALFEMGAHTNSRESAQRSTAYMAEVLDTWFERHFDD